MMLQRKKQDSIKTAEADARERCSIEYCVLNKCEYVSAQCVLGSLPDSPIQLPSRIIVPVQPGSHLLAWMK